jgi:dTDP-4-amino-4,6-dideoxygalactose transaminase
MQNLKSKITYNKQFIDKTDINLVTKSLKNKLITTGNYVNSFEKTISNKFKNKFTFSCNSGTAALHLAFLSIGLKKNDIVIMPAINFIASYSMANFLGAKIFLIDVDPETGQITPEKIIECVKLNKLKKIKAIVSMYLGGYVKNNIDFYNLKKKYKCFLIEDACHAIGAKYKYKSKNYYIGSCKHSDICTFSFHPVKTITTGEGGALTTNSILVAEKIKKFRSHGIIKHKEKYWDYDIKEMSFNYRLSDINCSLGLSQIKKLDRFIAQRKKIFEFYKDKFKLFNNYIKIINSNSKSSGFHLVILNINFKKLKSNKNKFFKFLNKNNIFPQFHYIPIYKFSFYKKKQLNKFKGSESYFKNSISLPIYHELNKKNLNYIFQTVRKFILN